MAFGIGTNTEHPEHQLLAGAVNEVAVKCWFTSTGRSIPLMMKLQTESDGIIEVSDSGIFFGKAVLCGDFELEIQMPGRGQSPDAGIYAAVLPGGLCMEAGCLTKIKGV